MLLLSLPLLQLTEAATPHHRHELENRGYLIKKLAMSSYLQLNHTCYD